jgi:hypothetical protein
VNLLVGLMVLIWWEIAVTLRSMWPYDECVITVSESFSGFAVCCVQCYFLKVFHKYITDHRR